MRRKATGFALVGDRFHNSDYIRTALGRTLARQAGVGIDFTDEVTHLSAETLEGYRLLIVFRDAHMWPQGYGPEAFWPGMQIRVPERDPFGLRESQYPGYRELAPLPIVSEPPLAALEATGVRWMTEAQGRAVKAFVEGGGAALVYHNATYIAAGNRDFREVLGAATRDHPPIRPFRVRITNPDHPITRGVNDFVVTDEQHFVTYDGDPAHVFMRSVNEDGLTHQDLGTSCQAGWAREYGKGRVCYLAPGHLIPALWNPEYVRIQQNAVRWLLGGDVAPAQETEVQP